jgi:hypothetical protein
MLIWSIPSLTYTASLIGIVVLKALAFLICAIIGLIVIFLVIKYFGG